MAVGVLIKYETKRGYRCSFYGIDLHWSSYSNVLEEVSPVF